MRRKTAVAGTLSIAIVLCGIGLGSAGAQPMPGGVLADGNAIVTGFSGARSPTQIAPGIDPVDKTYIDLAGPAARVIDLQTPGGPPQAQFVPAPKPFTVTAERIGQVFGVALDNATPPNIYVAATSAYGLPIVVPDRDGDGLPDRVRAGVAGAFFMPGLFGPPQSGGGPGSIWRIDGASGATQLFANVTFDGASNAGAALGGLAFDPASNSLFVADRATGLIHRFDLAGTERDRYDHGIQGRPAAGLPPVPYDPARRLDITSPRFQSDNPATWGYAARPRLVFGLAVRAGRLYYAVADGLQIWSVALSADGAIVADARIEITVPPVGGASEISRIIFDAQGRMLLSERAAPTGAYDFGALAQEGAARVLRYAPARAGGAGSFWQPAPDEYAIGFAAQMRNGNGGIAIGYGYDALGRQDRNFCSGFLWSTGEQLRVSPDPGLAARLAQSGPTIVNGLQGNDIDLVAPANVPPLQTDFIDYDDQFQDPDGRGHVGDIAIWRICGRAATGGRPFATWFGRPGYLTGGAVWGWGHERRRIVPPPRRYCPPTQTNQCGCPTGTTQQAGFQCCPFDMFPGPNGQCQSLCPGGINDPVNNTLCKMGFAPIDRSKNIPLETPQDFANLPCLDGSMPIAGGTLGYYCPPPPNLVCAAGFQPDPIEGCKPTQQFTDCWQNKQGQQTWPQPGLDGSCQQLCPAESWAFPAMQCCPNGTTPGPDGKCGGPPSQQCPPNLAALADGTCCPPGQVTNIGICCAAGQTPQPDGYCLSQTCPPNSTPVDGSCCQSSQVSSAAICCPAGTTPQPDGSCLTQPCPSGTTEVGGTCCPRAQVTASGICCPSGQTPQPDGSCQAKQDGCPPGVTNPLTGACPPASGCPANWMQKSNGQCCPPPGSLAVGAAAACVCPQGQNLEGQKCVPSAPPGLIRRVGCFAGFVQLPNGDCCRAGQVTTSGQCCTGGQMPDASGRTCVPVPPAGTFIPGVQPPSRLLVPQTPPLRTFVPPSRRLTPPPLQRRTIGPPPRRHVAPPSRHRISTPGVRRGGSFTHGRSMNRSGPMMRGGRGFMRRSDIALKHDIVLVDRLDNGLGLYRFSYRGSNKVHVGVIAQEVQSVMPAAVARGRDGYLRVHYDRLGLRMTTWDQWIAARGYGLAPTAPR